MREGAATWEPVTAQPRHARAAPKRLFGGGLAPDVWQPTAPRPAPAPASALGHAPPHDVTGQLLPKGVDPRAREAVPAGSRLGLVCGAVKAPVGASAVPLRACLVRGREGVGTVHAGREEAQSGRQRDRESPAGLRVPCGSRGSHPHSAGPKLLPAATQMARRLAPRTQAQSLSTDGALDRGRGTTAGRRQFGSGWARRRARTSSSDCPALGLIGKSGVGAPASSLAFGSGGAGNSSL